MNWLLVALLGYVGVQLLLGLAVSRKIASESDYLVAGRQLGPVLVVFSMFATWFGAESCIGAAGAVYQHGLFTRFGGASSAGAALVVGTIVWVIGAWGGLLDTPYLASLASAAVAYVSTAAFERAL